MPKGKQVAVTHFYSKKKFLCFERVADELRLLDHPNIVKVLPEFSVNNRAVT